jgi:hypothetical protein
VPLLNTSALRIGIDIGGILGVNTGGGFIKEPVCIEGSASVLLKTGCCQKIHVKAIHDDDRVGIDVAELAESAARTYIKRSVD